MGEQAIELRYDTILSISLLINTVSIKLYDIAVDKLHTCTHIMLYSTTADKLHIFGQKRKGLTYFGFSLFLLAETSSRALENSLSDGTEVPGMHKYFIPN